MEFEYEIKDTDTGEVKKLKVPAAKVAAAEAHWAKNGYTVVSKRDLSGPAPVVSPSPVGPDADIINQATKEVGDVGMRSSLMGGILQGISLGAEDEVQIFGPQTPQEKELLRKRQEAENPVTFGAGKIVGGLAPGVAAGGSGAYLGGLAGGAIGGMAGGIGALPGAAIGALAGGVLGAGGAGTAESYLNKPQATRELEWSDAGWGIVSGLLNAAGDVAAPVLRKVKSTISSKILGDAVKAGTPEALDLAAKGLNAEIAQIDSQLTTLGKELARRRSEMLAAPGNNTLKETFKLAEDKLTKLMGRKADLVKSLEATLNDPLLNATGRTAVGVAGGSALRAIPGELSDEQQRAALERQAMDLAVARLSTPKPIVGAGETEPGFIDDSFLNEDDLLAIRQEEERIRQEQRKDRKYQDLLRGDRP